MTKEEVKKAIIDSLRRFPEAKGVEVCGDTRPIPDLGLESEDGIAWASELEEMGFNLALDVNPLVDDERQCARTVDEIVNLVLEHIEIN
jgi:hypothetical protein